MLTRLKVECRATCRWPNVIADLIAEYAQLTTEEKVERLVGPNDTGRDVVAPDGKCRMTLWWSHAAADMLILVLPGSMVMMPKERLALSIDCRQWRPEQGPPTSMSDSDFAILDEWLATAEAAVEAAKSE